MDADRPKVQGSLQNGVFLLKLNLAEALLDEGEAELLLRQQLVLALEIAAALVVGHQQGRQEDVLQRLGGGRVLPLHGLLVGQGDHLGLGSYLQTTLLLMELGQKCLLEYPGDQGLYLVGESDCVEAVADCLLHLKSDLACFLPPPLAKVIDTPTDSLVHIDALQDGSAAVVKLLPGHSESSLFIYLLFIKGSYLFLCT